MSKHERVKEKKKTKNKKHTGRKILLFLVIVIIALGAYFAKRVYDLDGNWMAALLGHNKQTLENLEELQVLIIGESTGMTDTIIACRYNPKTQEASMLSIPRDTFTGTDTSSARASQKINSIYIQSKDPTKTLDAVNKVTGLNIQKYVFVDTEALIKMVDTIGGVEFDVPIDMKYDDGEQNLHIDLKAGKQKLTGEKVEQLVRFRHNNDGSTYPYEYGMEDYGRMKTQRNLIIAVAKQSLKLKNLTEVKHILNIMNEYVDTNMDISDIKDYIPYARSFDLNSIKTAQLPGESTVLNGIWFFLNNKRETTTVVQELFPKE